MGYENKFDKCKVLTPFVDNIMIQEENIENISNFVYLGSSIHNINKDIERRVTLALLSFGQLRKSIWSKKIILLKLKMWLYRAMILLIVTYASETSALNSW